MSAGPAVVSGLTQSISYARHLAAQPAPHGRDGNAGCPPRLRAARVTESEAGR